MSETDQTVVFVGLGYIGLPTAVTLANSGVRVKGVDVNESVVERVARGEVTIVEPGLEEELKRAVDQAEERVARCSRDMHRTRSVVRAERRSHAQNRSRRVALRNPADVSTSRFVPGSQWARSTMPIATLVAKSGE